MTVVFAQGMRRSGTTILYDLLFDDPRIRCWYEPLNRVRPAPGGGSRTRNVDYLAPVLELRERYLAGLGDDSLTQDDLNWGAPRDPSLEMRPGWPDHVRGLMSELAGSGEHVFVKLTRAPFHVPDLAAVAGDVVFLHLVRDPRAVAQSHVFRRLPETRAAIEKDGTFFTLTTGFDQWRAETMVDRLIAERPELAEYAGRPAYFRLLLLWRELTARTLADAERCFPGRHALVWHDRLCADPVEVLRGVYGLFGLTPTWRTRRFAKKHVRPAKPPYRAEAAEWREAMAELGLEGLVERCRGQSL